MVKKLFTLFCGSVIAFSLSTAMFAQEAPTQKKMDKNAKQTRWENEMTIHHDSTTHWVSQEHGGKKVNEIDPTQVKEGDRVIAKGVWEKGVLHATLISKRLSHSPLREREREGYSALLFWSGSQVTARSQSPSENLAP